MKSLTSLINEAFADHSEELSPELYEELIGTLRHIARRHLRNASVNVQESDLIHEVLMRILDKSQLEGFESSDKFFGYVGMAIRHLVIEWTRSDKAQKRGGGSVPIALEGIPEIAQMNASHRNAAIRDLISSLDELRELSPNAYRVVELKFFFGYSQKDIVELTSLSFSKVKSLLVFAYSFLRRNIGSTQDQASRVQ